MGDIGLMTLCMDADGEDEEDLEEVKALGAHQRYLRSLLVSGRPVPVQVSKHRCLVVMELDRLSSNPSKLGKAAQESAAYITSHVWSHSTSLKIQMLVPNAQRVFVDGEEDG
ncbi:hypothetical protein M405DRAFT_858734 [Rhizopogon salebrosus TDB-379]|nr:hypothetical protein M405DRAFT_858734 [Rhizopogon salebrosus TDB-379]